MMALITGNDVRFSKPASLAALTATAPWRAAATQTRFHQEAGQTDAATTVERSIAAAACRHLEELQVTRNGQQGHEAYHIWCT